MADRSRGAEPGADSLISSASISKTVAFAMLRSVSCLVGLLTLPLVGQAQAAASAPVRSGDRVEVRFVLPPDPRLTAEREPATRVVVDDRGTVALPLVGTVAIGGLAAGAALDTVRARLGQFVRPGGVLVTLERRIPIHGDVGRPELYYLDLTMRLRDALTLAGGATESGKRNEVLLLRNGERRRIVDWQTTAAGETELRSGDELIVPRRPWLQRYAMTMVSLVSVAGSILLSAAVR